MFSRYVKPTIALERLRDETTDPACSRDHTRSNDLCCFSLISFDLFNMLSARDRHLRNEKFTYIDIVIKEFIY